MPYLIVILVAFGLGFYTQRADIANETCSRAQHAPHTSPHDKPFNVTRCVLSNVIYLEDY
jgi:hypothetical protein